MRRIGIIGVILLSGCASTKDSVNWTYSENVNHFEKSVFVESTYFDDENMDDSGFTISCDKGGRNKIFSKFIEVKDEDYMAYPDIGSAKFDFVIDDILDVSTLGLYTYDKNTRMFVGMSNTLPKQLLNAMANPSMSEKRLHVRMTVKGIHIKTLKVALETDAELKSKLTKTNIESVILDWVKQNAANKGFYHSFEKHVNLNGFGEFIENYNGCTISSQ